MICLSLSLPILGAVLVRRASASCGRKKESISKTFLGLSGSLGRRQGKALSMADEEIAVKRQKACDGDVVEDGKGSESNGNGLPPSSSTDPVEMAEDGKEESKPDGISAVIPGWFSEISPMWPGGFFFPSLQSRWVWLLGICFCGSSWKEMLLIIDFLCMVLFLEHGLWVFCFLVAVLLGRLKYHGIWDFGP